MNTRILYYVLREYTLHWIVYFKNIDAYTYLSDSIFYCKRVTHNKWYEYSLFS